MKLDDAINKYGKILVNLPEDMSEDDIKEYTQLYIWLKELKGFKKLQNATNGTGEWYIIKPNKYHKDDAMMCGDCGWMMFSYDLIGAYHFCPYCGKPKKGSKYATSQEEYEAELRGKDL